MMGGMPALRRHHERHRTDRIGWLRAAVLGANDGIVSTASLVVGVAAAGTAPQALLLTGIAGLMAGAMSMAAGEYVSVHSQSDAEQADLARERAELSADFPAERRELAALYVARGVDADLAQLHAKSARETAYATLRRRLIAFVDELTLLLGPDDPRWEVFGLNIPSSPRAPEPASQLVLSLAGAGQILAEWVRGVRSSNNRVLIQILGVDADYREYSKSGNVTDELIKSLPAGSTVKVKIIALNGSLEAASGPEAQITLP
jgi:hypothetical protein